jgi:DNA modification methylase
MMFTNEELRVSLYFDSSEHPPTIASKVTSDTPIENLNLNWREKDLPQRERTKHVHGLHPYLGKFIPQLVEIFLRKYFAPCQTILDPFVGSGTILVQANELGINSIGCDIDYHEQHIYAYHLLGLEDKRINEIGPATNGSSGKAREQYQKDIAAAFRAVTASLKPGSRVIVIAGDRYNLYEKIAQMSGLEIEAIVNRHVNRRTGRRSTEFYESIFIWRKP